ncbi:hydroxylaminobenzene mutase [Microbacterium sp. AG790]|uniref:hypothetical protein n=1 Tax=Microbacterium sp. AG790 TaxID=2183995 RepID=UPI000EB43D4D|nr:hypothetical protein [Microbacterium sp. AG790]RKS93473.1 hydroxylaminobenzene mutase [Microbacterium sp. AG790]
MSAVLLLAGMISLALGALSGFILLMAVDYPERLRKMGIVDPARVRQVHLDWIIMGTVMTATALAVPQMNVFTAILVLIGGVVNPATFVPMAFSRTVATTAAFQIVSFASFTSLSLGLVLAVVEVIAGRGALVL